MNINTIPVNVIDPGTNFARLVPVVAEVTKIVREEAGYSLVGIRDFAGKEVQVLIRGNARPTLQTIGQVVVFSLSATTKGQYTNYSGFYNPSEAIPQQFQGQHPPVLQKSSGGQQASGKSTSSPHTQGDSKNRSMTLAYAKDLAVANKIQVNEIPMYTKSFLAFVETGKFPTDQQAQPEQPVQPNNALPVFQPEPERVVEEVYTGGVGTGPQTEYVEPVQVQTQETPVGSEYTARYPKEDIPF
jgi:hypothetical protein